MPVSQPQIRVNIDGVAVAGAIAAEIEQVAHFAADRFVVTFAMQPSLNGGILFFSALGAGRLTIEFAAQRFGYQTLLTGQIDDIRIDLLQNTAVLFGRDMSALLIDSEIAETFANQTSSQIAASVAARHGLSSNVTSTSTQVGQYYELDYAKTGLGLNSYAGSEWNLLSWLAMVEGFSVSVNGTTLNFGPPVSSIPVVLTPQNFTELALDLATGIPTTAIIKSWNVRNKAVVTQSAGTGNGANATLIRPNLTSRQAATAASHRLAELAMHKTLLLGTMPGELSLAPGMQLSLSGTNAPLDQTYMIDMIRRVIDARRGFTQTIRAHAVG